MINFAAKVPALAQRTRTVTFDAPVALELSGKKEQFFAVPLYEKSFDSSEENEPSVLMVKSNGLDRGLPLGVEFVTDNCRTPTRGRLFPISRGASPIFEVSALLTVGMIPTSPRVLYPQHFRVESIRIAHEWKPAETLFAVRTIELLVVPNEIEVAGGLEYFDLDS